MCCGTDFCLHLFLMELRLQTLYSITNQRIKEVKKVKQVSSFISLRKKIYSEHQTHLFKTSKNTHTNHFFYFFHAFIQNIKIYSYSLLPKSYDLPSLLQNCLHLFRGLRATGCRRRVRHILHSNTCHAMRRVVSKYKKEQLF